MSDPEQGPVVDDTQARRADAPPGHGPSEATAGEVTGTGDRGVDAVLQDLDAALAGSDGDHVAALEEAHRRLQARLAGPVVPPPGQARPGPR